MATKAPKRSQKRNRVTDEARTSLTLSVTQLRRLSKAARTHQYPETKGFISVLLDILDRADPGLVEAVVKPARADWYSRRDRRYGRTTDKQEAAA